MMRMCNGECRSWADDHCGMYMDGEECPACKAIREQRTKQIVEDNIRRAISGWVGQEILDGKVFEITSNRDEVTIRFTLPQWIQQGAETTCQKT